MGKRERRRVYGRHNQARGRLTTFKDIGYLGCVSYRYRQPARHWPDRPNRGAFIAGRERITKYPAAPEFRTKSLE